MSTFFIYPVIAYANPDNGDLVCVASIIFTGAVICCVAVLLFLASRRFLFEIGGYLATASSPSNDIKSAFQLIRLVYFLSIPFAFGVLPLMLIFGSWNYLRRKFTYVNLVIQFLSVSSQDLVMLLLCCSNRKNKIQESFYARVHDGVTTTSSTAGTDGHSQQATGDHHHHHHHHSKKETVENIEI